MFTEREAPEHILERLREIDPKADLVYIGDEAWMLGVREQNDAARRKVLKEITEIRSEGPLVTNEARARRLELLQFYAGGFRPISLYEDTPVPGYEIVKDFRVRDWNWHNRREEAFQEGFEASDMWTEVQLRIQLIKDWMAAELPFIHRFALRGRRSFTNLINFGSRA